MTEPTDIVAELDAWLAWRKHPHNPPPDVGALVQCARDRIKELEQLTDGAWVWEKIKQARDDARAEALEDAARFILSECPSADRWAAAIRALKDKLSPPAGRPNAQETPHEHS